MTRKIHDGFIFSAGVILFATAVAKLYSAGGTAQVLTYLDPIIPASNRQVFYISGLLELAISAFLLLKNGGQKTKLLVIAWLATTFLLYRVGLAWEHAPNLCDCLGNLSDTLPISPRIINPVMLAVLGWLFFGSYSLIIVDYLGRPRLPSANVAQSPKGAES
jgi:hypothetical protein